jgi:hypothetical protein
MRSMSWILILSLLSCDDESEGAGFSQCSNNSDCILAGKSCCASCGPFELANYDAINKAQADAHRQLVCPKQALCDPCQGEAIFPFVATCSGGTCKGIDVQNDPTSECSTEGDCELRLSPCCECGASTSLLVAIAKSKAEDYKALVCDPKQSCATCNPVLPSDKKAACQNGHCVVAQR